LDPVVGATDVVPFPIPPGSDPGDSTQAWAPDPFWYEEPNTFPPTPESLTSNDGYRGIRIGDFAALPFEWNSGTRDLTLYQTVEVTLVLEPIPSGEAVPARLRPERRFSREKIEVEWVRTHVINPEGLDSYEPPDSSGIVADPVEPIDPLAVVTESNHATGFHPTDRPSLEGPAIDMVILTNDHWITGETWAGSMTETFQEWADWRTGTGLPTVVRSMDWVRANYSGSDDPESIRTFLKDAYSLWGTDFVLLGGDTEVVPARHSGGGDNPGNAPDAEYPSSWYYAGLDAAWGTLQNGSFSPSSADVYPELWVGRVPIRDAAEAAAFLGKIRSYERVPGFEEPAPPASFYTKAVLFAGLTNFGGWTYEDDRNETDSTNPESQPPIGTNWRRNGIWQAENLKNLVLDELSFESYRLYPNLDFSASCTLLSFLPCYPRIQAALDLTGAPEDSFTTPKVLSALETEEAGVVFHVEHSNRFGLGGLSDVESQTAPARDLCFETGICNCTSWRTSCFNQYKAANPRHEGFSREQIASLDNGPSYFVGLSNGSQTGMFDGDAVVENLVRDPDGGAVAFCGKTVSNIAFPNTDVTDVGVTFYDEALLLRRPAGAALANATLRFGIAGAATRRIWHLFGDPSMKTWSAAPSGLELSSNHPELGNPGPYDLQITVEDEGFNPLEGARVCVSRESDVFAIAWSDENGVARFPSLLVPATLEGLQVRAIADNYVPGDLFIEPATMTELEDEPAVVYESHEASDSENSGPTADLFEPGDRVEIDVTMTNVAGVEAPEANARLVVTPRIRMSLARDGQVIPDEIHIGRAAANAPAGQDTFTLLVNENGIRPELPPPVFEENHFHVWRDAETFDYHIRVEYSDPPHADLFTGVVHVEGGVALDLSGLDGEDDADLAPDGGSVTFTLDPDSTPDELVLEARGAEWVAWVDDECVYDEIDPSESEVGAFAFDLLPALPAGTRLNFTLATRLDEAGDPDPTFSDFYLETAAPELTLALQRVEQDLETSIPECDCLTGFDGYVYRPSLFNSGNAIADSVQIELDWTGQDVTICAATNPVWMTVDPGEEVTATFGMRFCDSATHQRLRIESAAIRRVLNGEVEEHRVQTPNTPWNPWPLSSVVLVSDLRVRSTLDGLRVEWKLPVAAPIGYHVYLDSAEVVDRRTRCMLQESAQARVYDLDFLDLGGDRVDYRVGVSAVTANLVETSIAWAEPNNPSLPVRAGWPRRVAKGAVKSVLAVDLDDDGDLEVVAAGRVISAWGDDGASVLSGVGDTGLLYDPITDAEIDTELHLNFWGEISAGDVDGDDDVELAGAFNGRVYVVKGDALNGNHSSFPKDLEVRSTITLADLDLDGELEVLANSYRSSALHVWNANGTSFRSGAANGVYATVANSPYNYAGVAVGQLHDWTGLEIVHPHTDGLVTVWKQQASGFGSRVVWVNGPCPAAPGTPCGGPFSTPVVADVNADYYPDVVLSARSSVRRVAVLDGHPSAAERGKPIIGWRGHNCSTPVPDACLYHTPEFFAGGVQASAVIDLHDGLSDNLEVVVARLTEPEEAQPDQTPEEIPDEFVTKVSIGLPGNGTINSSSDVIGLVQTATDTIPLPGRKSELQGISIGTPVVANIDDDSAWEIFASSNHGGVFAWEVTPTEVLDSLEVRQEVGWPIAFGEVPTSPVVADLEGVGDLELIVGLNDGHVYVFELPESDGGEVLWGMAGYDAARTSHVPTDGDAFARGQGQSDEPGLAQNASSVRVSPNPFNPAVEIRYGVEMTSDVNLEIFDVGGRRVRRLLDEVRPPGAHALFWDGRDDVGKVLPTGIYFLRIHVGDSSRSVRLVLAK